MYSFNKFMSQFAKSCKVEPIIAFDSFNEYQPMISESRKLCRNNGKPVSLPSFACHGKAQYYTTAIFNEDLLEFTFKTYMN